MDEYQDLIDEAEDQYEDTQQLQEDQVENYETTYPVSRDKSDLYTWFWKVVKLGKISEQDLDSLKVAKVGNLNNQEIGEYGVSVRDALNLANLGEIFHHPKFGKYFKTRAMITSATSMSKKGWFMDLSISQKRVRERAKSSSPNEKSKWRLFNRKDQNQGNQEE